MTAMAEETREAGHQPLSLQRIGRELVERGESDRGRMIELANGSSDRIDRSGHTYLRPEHESDRQAGLSDLRRSRVGDRPEVFANRVQLGVADHADDLECLCAVGKRSPERPGVAQNVPGEHLVDDRHFRRGRGIPIAEVATADERRLHHREVAGADQAAIALGLDLSLRRSDVDNRVPG
jgi:hypothetical protein